MLHTQQEQMYYKKSEMMAVRVWLNTPGVLMGCLAEQEFWSIYQTVVANVDWHMGRCGIMQNFLSNQLGSHKI